jgi:hypothetical protein
VGSNDHCLAKDCAPTAPSKDQIIVHREDLAVTRWDDGPIEFLLVDIGEMSIEPAKFWKRTLGTGLIWAGS